MTYKLLDLFCGAGGAAVGYNRAGFEVVGVDIKPQPRYPFEFHQADAIQYLADHGQEFDAIHASPPCQGYSITAHIPNVDQSKHVFLLDPVRAALPSGKPYIIENVVGAPLVDPIMLCGTYFNLKVFRHRLFESNRFLFHPPHTPHGEKHIGQDGYCCVAGHGDNGWKRVDYYHRTVPAWRLAMGIDWMTRDEITQAIPPAYTEYIGLQLRAHLVNL